MDWIQGLLQLAQSTLRTPPLGHAAPIRQAPIEVIAGPQKQADPKLKVRILIREPPNFGDEIAAGSCQTVIGGLAFIMTATFHVRKRQIRQRS